MRYRKNTCALLEYNNKLCKRNSKDIDDYDNRGCKSYHTR